MMLVANTDSGVRFCECKDATHNENAQESGQSALADSKSILHLDQTHSSLDDSHVYTQLA